MHKMILTFTLLFAANLTSVSLDPGLLADSRELVTAHRGSSGSAPENTLSSIRKAIEDGAGYAEIDVQETADGIIVLMHDDNARRTTGIDKPVWLIPSAELLHASAGAWFHQRFEAERVPTLEQAIDTAKGKIKLNIELKNNGHQKQLAEKTADMIIKKKCIRECTVTSFDASLLQKVKQRKPSIKTGLIISNKTADYGSLFTSKDFDVLSTAHTIIDEEFMRLAKRHQKEVYAWTVNDQDTMSRMILLGVSSVITDYPERLTALLKET